MKARKSSKKLTVLVMTALMGFGACSVASAANQTGTTFNKGQIDGKSAFSFSSDFAKYRVWDSTTKTYTFDLDSTLNTKSITGNAKDVNVNAAGVTLTLNSSENLGIQSYRGRGYKADPNYYANLHDVTITAKKVVVNVDRTSKPNAEDSYGIISGSSNGKTVKVTGDVDINIASNFLKAADGSGDRDPAVTCGIGTLNHGRVVIDGNAKIRVKVPTQKSLGSHGENFLSHYYVHGISAMLNYDGDTPGGNILVTGDVDIESDGTGVRAGTRSTVTIGGGGKININKDNGLPHFALNAEEATINMNVRLDAAGNVIGAGDHKTEIYGNVGLIDREGTATTFGNTPTRINVGLTTADSVFKGVVLDNYKEQGKNEPDKRAIREATGLNLYLQNGAEWHNESWGTMIPTRAGFSGSKLRALHGGADAEHAGKIFQNDANPISVENYSGHTQVTYARTAPDATTFAGGGLVIKKAAAGSAVTVRTAAGVPAAKQKEVLSALAQKLSYTGAKTGEQNLAGTAEIIEGATTPSAKRELVYDARTGQASLSGLMQGDAETKLMSGVKSAMTASSMAWRAEANDLMKRMGDLRLSPEQTGTWVRLYRGKSSSDKDRTNFHMNYHTIQVGYDWRVSPAWRMGVAGSYMKGSSSYGMGSGENKEGNFGVYGTWTGQKGEYVDLIAKVGRLSNDYDVFNADGNRMKGDYRAWGGSLSAEYGKRIMQGGGSYVEPQAELVYSHLNGADYTGDVYIGGVRHDLRVNQSGFNSLIGRVGVGFGQQTARSTWGMKLSVYHEFAGNMDTTYADIYDTSRTSLSFKDTWVGAQLHGTLKVSDACSIYGDFEKTFAGDIKTDWRVDAGVRWGF